MIYEGDTLSLIKSATGVVTINSTAGIEAIQLGVNTLVLGQAFYNIDGLTLSARNQQELELGLNQLGSFVPNPYVRQGLIQYLECEYQIPGSWKKSTDHHIKKACERIIKEVNQYG